ncbi:MAG: hypothetical protein RLN63_05730, partial [Miltoncostaeaceae bacterium]
ADEVLSAGAAIGQVSAHAERLTLLVPTRARAAAEVLPGVDDVIGYDGPCVERTPAGPRAESVVDLIRSVRAGDHAMALILGPPPPGPLPLALILRLAGVPWIAADRAGHPASLLDLCHQPPGDPPQAERARSLVEAAGFPPAAVRRTPC